ncbi:MAG: DNA repair protein RecO [Candidatus Omnitrophica bacterium]|nr:DNA repair protein RecO [Candidatus Omnitrophota bacterium]
MIAKDFGFVLKRIDFRETSLIVTVFTQRFGKINCILKGFYTLKKEFSSSMDIFTYNEFIFYPKRSTLWLISFADLIEDFPFLRKDLEKNSIACKFIEVIDKTLPLWSKNPSVFSLLRDSLLSFAHHQPTKLLCIFFIKFLTFCGFKPEFTKCIRCHKNLYHGFSFSISCGGLLCEKCRVFYSDAYSISSSVVAIISYIQRTDFPLVLRIEVSFNDEEEILNILNGFLTHHLNFNLFSNLYLQ